MQVDVAGSETYVGLAGSSLADAAAPAVLFIHGAGFDHSVWVMQARYFARQGFRVLAPDLPAHGRSAGAALTSIDAMADWCAELLQQLGVQTTAVVGHSMGSLAAYAMAHRHAQRVRALALLGISAPMPVTPLLLDAARDDHPAAFDMANTWSHSPQGRRGGVGNPGVFTFGAARRLLQRCAPGVFHADLAACNEFDAQAYSGAVAAPVLVLSGAQDQMTPAARGAAVADKLVNDERPARHVVLPGTGHALMSEQPNAVLDALIEIV